MSYAQFKLFSYSYSFFVFPFGSIVLEMYCFIIKTSNSNSQRVFWLLLLDGNDDDVWIFVSGVVTLPCYSSFSSSVIDGKYYTCSSHTYYMAILCRQGNHLCSGVPCSTQDIMTLKVWFFVGHKLIQSN